MAASPKRLRWKEDDVADLPEGEHDYFDRKSGALFDDPGALLGTLGKAASAFSNSGGGHLVLGVADDGSFDGVPPRIKGRTTTREWLEQKLPTLTEYPLSDFRVHEVERAEPSRIPAERQVIVIDFGDSALAPHQCAHGGGEAIKHMYYCRQGGHSVPAPHFYVELLRQRLTAPRLKATPSALEYVRGQHSALAGQPNGVFVIARLPMRVENVGRVAAYKWTISWQVETQSTDYDAEISVNSTEWPMGVGTTGVRMDDTVLPGTALHEPLHLGMHIRADPRTRTFFAPVVVGLLQSSKVRYRIATESSLGEYEELRLADAVDPQRFADAISDALG
jgi:hypothetical protein